MRIIDEEGGVRYWLAVDSLVDVHVSGVCESLRSAGYPVLDVRKVVHDGRGRLLVEFSESVDLMEAKKALDAGKPAGDYPTTGHYYRTKTQMVLRTSHDTPVVIPQNTVLKHAGITVNQSQFWIQNGKHKDVTVRMSGAEWHLHRNQMTDLGDDLSLGKGKGLPDSANQLKSVPPDGGSGDQGSMPGLTPPKKKTPKKKGFPPFPKRTPISAYMSKKVKK